MSLRELVSKYISSAEHVFSEIRIIGTSDVEVADVESVVESAKAYLEDAKYYRDKKQFKVSLASVAYCEGLLDALRLLGMVKFEWPIQKKTKREK